MAKAKTILECVVLYAKEAPKQKNEQTGLYDIEPKYKFEVYIEDEIQDGEHTRPSTQKLKTNIAKDEFKRGPSKFEVEHYPYCETPKRANNSIRVLKILK